MFTEEFTLTSGRKVVMRELMGNDNFKIMDLIGDKMGGSESSALMTIGMARAIYSIVKYQRIKENFIRQKGKPIEYEDEMVIVSPLLKYEDLLNLAGFFRSSELDEIFAYWRELNEETPVNDEEANKMVKDMEGK